ncbi:PncC family amidohydrolase [Algoriphagus sp. 4150]|uniref:CinA family protein n=1 Tax=Algoriphagus sp. 4150 TaxID=2817756 RepID=UPI00286624B2|nr:CinA family protein [Algoriphagus sp. 4150]MDR7127849.1 PncC family amidohydrolase [Algoriphagus sp. 4150]
MNLICEEDTKEALDIIRKYCLNHNYRISVAESATAGLLQLMLSSCENAGMFFCGGITAYNCRQKMKQLSIIDKNCMELHGVSMQIAEEMAHQIGRKFNSDLSLSLTGFATPVPEKGINELFAYGSFWYRGEIVFTEKFTTTTVNQFEGQYYYASSLIRICANSLILQRLV